MIIALTLTAHTSFFPFGCIPTRWAFVSICGEVSRFMDAADLDARSAADELWTRPRVAWVVLGSGCVMFTSRGFIHSGLPLSFVFFSLKRRVLKMYTRGKC